MAIEQTGHRPHHAFKILIVGCGLGGLTCAIACLREGLQVTMVEQASELGEIGAGIQMPPNAVRVMDDFGLVEKLEKAGAVNISGHCLLKYSNGDSIATRPGHVWQRKHFGQAWYVIHRADYHRVLREEATRLGATIRLASEVISADSKTTSVVLASQERLYADIIIGADGLRSVVRNEVLGYHVGPSDTGDLAYRATFPKERVEALDESLIEPSLRCWLGPHQHAVLYPVRGGSTYNLVLVCPDDLPPGVATEEGNTQEMRNLFKGWDPRQGLTKMIAQVDNALKWKICHMKELDTWCRGSIALLGDACHPTLPYQAQGAAMAVEDGAALGVLLGKLSRSGLPASKVPDVLHLYELIRKQRTTINVQGAVANQKLYHMVDGPEADARDEAFLHVDWENPDHDFQFGWGHVGYLKRLMAFNATVDAGRQFDEWVAEIGQ
ncbi:Salicylate hydroxylase [Penicillium longicatenatum]|uniref:Salicylate hydroxylase n=1 Tax=Penicillium longicatenatum TaxID=1561947 RepID=UPI00254691F6|nr:Salicylate hydroxylase [Penicillium longicatenatum]KAJ5651378.1 Salicylate hydroxylase [Penicillium longicatenatum]